MSPVYSDLMQVEELRREATYIPKRQPIATPTSCVFFELRVLGCPRPLSAWP